MLTFAATVFCVFVALVFLGFGIFWNHNNLTNILLKTASFILAFISLLILVKLPGLPALYVFWTGTCALGGAIVWRTDSVLNLVLKIVLIMLAVFSGFMLLFSPVILA